MAKYIWQSDNWPKLKWDDQLLVPQIEKILLEQGRLWGRIETLGYQVREQTLLQALTQDIVKSSEIEGVILDTDQVNSSLARRLGFNIEHSIQSERNIDAIVEITLDATLKCHEPLSTERLFRWHGALFPTGRDEWGHLIRVGQWRDDSTGSMQIVSGAFGHERIHYEAPPASQVEQDMAIFLDWFNKTDNLSPLLKASVAHFWFVAIHPFDDGNGRITRAIADMALARADPGSMRLYSMSAQIRKERKSYYDILESVQNTNDADITAWNQWFFGCLERSIASTMDTLDNVLFKSQIWKAWNDLSLNARQTKMLNLLLDGNFIGKLTADKWAKMNKCSHDTANRDIASLITKSILKKGSAGGRSTSYELILLH